MPTGYLIRAGRVLAGLKATELAKLAKIDASTLSRLESFGHKKVGGQVETVDRVISALLRRGIKLEPDQGVFFVKPPRK